MTNGNFTTNSLVFRMIWSKPCSYIAYDGSVKLNASKELVNVAYHSVELHECFFSGTSKLSKWELRSVRGKQKN